MYRYTNISFPSLGIDIDPIREFSVGPLSVHMYGLIIAFGLVLATCYCMRRSRDNLVRNISSNKFSQITSYKRIFRIRIVTSQ